MTAHNNCSAESRDDLVRFGFASFSDRKFELIVINIKSGEEVMLEGQLRPDQTIEQIDKVLPTCVYVNGVRETDAYRDTVKKIAAVREKRLAELVEENAQLRADLAKKRPETLPGMIAEIYGELDAEDCAMIDREWARMRGYILPADGTSTLIPAPAQPAVEISQHIGWLKQYLAGMTEHNWRDMRMLAGRQLDALAAAQPPAAPVETCPRCGGSGLHLNGSGEPDECKKCKGNTVVQCSSAATEDEMGVIESDRLFAEHILADFGSFEEGIADQEKLAQWIRNVRRACSTPDVPQPSADTAELNFDDPLTSKIMGASRLHTHDHEMAYNITREVLRALPQEVPLKVIAEAIKTDLLHSGNHGCRIPASTAYDNFNLQGHVNLMSLARAVSSQLTRPEHSR